MHIDDPPPEVKGIMPIVRKQERMRHAGKSVQCSEYSDGRFASSERTYVYLSTDQHILASTNSEATTRLTVTKTCVSAIQIC